MKDILMWLVMAIIFLPCLLIFTEGTDGSFTIYNVIGLCYSLGLYYLIRHLVRKAR